MAIVYKISDIYSLSSDFKEKFKIFENLKEGDKLIITEENNFDIDNNTKLVQSFSRWWNNQNRYDSVEVLSQEITTYLSFLRFVYGAHKSPKCDTKERRKLKNIYKSKNHLVLDVVDNQSSLYKEFKKKIDRVEKAAK